MDRLFQTLPRLKADIFNLFLLSWFRWIQVGRGSQCDCDHAGCWCLQMCKSSSSLLTSTSQSDFKRKSDQFEAANNQPTKTGPT